tara:strand:- start:3339 stop:3752 length:414 start_codon:yes stop_codon:yes gene_type:complete
MSIRRTKATNITLTPDIEAYLDKRLAAVDKLIKNEGEAAICEVEVGKTTKHHQSGDIFRAEINLTIGGELLRAVATADTLKIAIDKVKKDILRELRKRKDKRLDFVKRGGAKMKGALQGFGKGSMRQFDRLRFKRRR